jgi:hypothetical protein
VTTTKKCPRTERILTMPIWGRNSRTTLRTKVDIIEVGAESR